MNSNEYDQELIRRWNAYKPMRAEIARLRAFAESVKNWDRLPLTELTDTDHERATAYRQQLEIHAEMARAALEGK